MIPKDFTEEIICKTEFVHPIRKDIQIRLLLLTSRLGSDESVIRCDPYEQGSNILDGLLTKLIKEDHLRVTTRMFEFLVGSLQTESYDPADNEPLGSRVIYLWVSSTQAFTPTSSRHSDYSLVKEHLLKRPFAAFATPDVSAAFAAH